VFCSFLITLTFEVGEIILAGLDASTGIGFGEMIAGWACTSS